MPNNVLSRNWKAWAKTVFKTALLCQFVRVLSLQKQTSSQFLVVSVGMWIAWVAFGLALVRRTLALCEELPLYRVVRTGELARETLPPSDAMYTVLLYEWRLFGGGWLFRLMARKYLVRPCPRPRLRPRPCPCPCPCLSLSLSLSLGLPLVSRQASASWEVPFAETGKDAAAEVRTYCARYGIPEEPWPWCNEPQDYESMHEFVCRSYAHGRAPPLGDAAVTSPAAGVPAGSKWCLPSVTPPHRVGPCGFPVGPGCVRSPRSAAHLGHY